MVRLPTAAYDAGAAGAAAHDDDGSWIGTSDGKKLRE